MKAVWSFWTKPFRLHWQLTWVSQKHHLLAWVLSLETAKKHYPKTALFTDSYGAQMLVDGLGLQFEQISVELDVLENQDPAWWALGKIYTYRSQTEPFVHIDSDVFLWKPLPDRMITAPLLAQNPEYFLTDTCWYRPENFERAIYAVNGWLPEEWFWYHSQCLFPKGFCCGIFGGNKLDFIRYYAELAIQMVEHPTNQPAWKLLDSETERNILVEQYLLNTCIEYHSNQPHSSYKNLDMQCLFDSMNDSLIPASAAKSGFTHLMSAKRNRAIAERLEDRVKREYPEYYERCIKLCEQIPIKPE